MKLDIHLFLLIIKILFRKVLTQTPEQQQQQNCFGGIGSYDKVTGRKFGSGVTSSVLTEQRNQALTRECLNLCKQQSSCRSFSLDYKEFRCNSYEVDSVGRKELFEVVSGVNYFEKTCFRGIPKANFDTLCGSRMWTFDRVPDAFLDGYVEKDVTNIQTKEECQKLCLLEESFTCRSCDHDEVQKICRLSKEDRRTQPQAFREVPGSGRDYLENQCAASAPTSCRYDLRPDISILSMDGLQYASNEDECQSQCDTETAFTCRSYTYMENRCYVSGDDTTSLGPVQLPIVSGAIYGEKKCIIEQCTGGVFTYEKMTGVILNSAISTAISSLTPGAIGITLECRDYCQKEGLSCPSFSVNYLHNQCDKLDRNSQGRDQDLVYRDTFNYFEKICLRGSEAMACSDKAWAFERVNGYEMDSYLYDRVLAPVLSRRDCEELCLKERNFVCRSALYNDITTECKLCREDRRTQPIHFRQSTSTRVDYLENQCIPTLTICPYQKQEGRYPTYTDFVQAGGVISQETCAQLCDNFQSFNCRSYAYYSSSGQCFISGDDTVSGRGSSAIQSRPGLTYFERDCQSVPTTFTTPPPSTPIVQPPAQRCAPNQRQVFAQVTGYEYIGSTGSLLYRGDSQVPGIAKECVERCIRASECHGFNLDYQRQECAMLQDISSTKPTDLKPSFGKAFFEGFCISVFVSCNKIWVYDRFVDRELVGAQPRDVIQFVSRVDCQRLCMEQRNYVCSSINYNSFRQECMLYESVYRTTAKIQISYSKGVDYLEKQCYLDTSSCPYDTVERDLKMLYITKTIDVTSNFQCERACNGEHDFNCRSYTYLDKADKSQCLLSSESRETGQSSAIQYFPRTLYAGKMCRPPSPSTPTPRPTRPPVTPPTQPTIPPTIRPTPPIPAVCTPDRYTYEKTLGMDFKYAKRERVYSRFPVGVVGDCKNECQRQGDRCKAFVVEYSKFQNCYWLDNAATDARSTLIEVKDFSYFEKICLREPTCGKIWTFDRVVGFELQLAPYQELPNVFKKAECQEFCLRSRPPCRSANYYYRRRLCRLYTETRRTRPNSFARSNQDVDYLENQCAAAASACQYREWPDRMTPYMDRVTRSFTLAECQGQCDSERDFTCRSVNYETFARECALSSEDLSTIPRGQLSLETRTNSIYSEKGTCEQVSVQCNHQDMLLSVNFDFPFNGRVYAKGNPTQCYMLGTGQTSLQFAISLGSRCGTKEETPTRFTNEVVVQQHPVIVTDNDRTIRVICSFETADRTVTLGSPVLGGIPGIDVTTRFQPTLASLVTNTAPPPNVVMRILDRTGRDATVVGLGDELSLRLELRQPETSLAIFARNLYARSKNGESLFLIDSTGCPTDLSIFPALSLDLRDRRTLFANFKAFRFPSTGLVNFEVQIRFCPERCQPVRCSNGLESFGKRKRRDLEEVNITNFELYTEYQALPIEDDKSVPVIVPQAAIVEDLLNGNVGPSTEEMTSLHTPYDNENYNTTIDTDDITTMPMSLAVERESTVNIINETKYPVTESIAQTESNLTTPLQAWNRTEGDSTVEDVFSFWTTNYKFQLEDGGNDDFRTYDNIPSILPSTAEYVAATPARNVREIPLSLAIMVGDDSDKNSFSDSSNRNDGNPVSDVLCASQSTIIATVVTVTLLHVGVALGAMFCCRWHRRNKKKKHLDDNLAIQTTCGNSDILFGSPDVNFSTIYGSYETPP
ncbi:uncharacterized protein [Centruroides vittatus]|uniref:uncharacterized protein n=1 Tax=Centruroides vittatus TaxID=120091 RepID=UPI003510C876